MVRKLSVGIGMMVLLLCHTGEGRTDEILLQDGTRVTGIVQLDHLVRLEEPGGPTSIEASKVREVTLHEGRVLFHLRNGDWISGRLTVRQLQIDQDGVWQLVNANTIRSLRLDRPEGASVIPLAPAATAAPPPAAATVQAPPAAATVQAPPAATVQAPPPVPSPGGAEATPPAYMSLEEQDAGWLPVTGEEQEPAQPSAKPAESRERGRFLVSADVGYVLVIGGDRDALGDGPGFGLSVSYEFLRRDPFFLAARCSYMRTIHGGKGLLDPLTQNINPLMFGVTGGYMRGPMDLHVSLQTGAVFLDSNGAPGGKASTAWGIQYGAGMDYRIVHGLAAGPELRFTHAIDGGSSTTWFDLLARVAYRF